MLATTCADIPIAWFHAQGGQTFENEEGSGGESIFGPTFEDEVPIAMLVRCIPGLFTTT